MQKTPKQKLAFWIVVIADAAFLVLLVAMLAGQLNIHLHFAVLDPKGVIAWQQRRLLVTAVSIMLIAAIPVYFLIFFFAWKYREDNQAATYSPDLHSNGKSTFALWAIPAAIILALGILNWKSTHELDPARPLASDQKPMTVEVVALQWKWLFIYPEQNIASVNFVEFPQNTPVTFRLTADAPINSFWIPQLGGQMYAMAGMSTTLNLMANHTGEFAGSAAEINGSGFSSMRFTAKSASQADFDAWVASVKKSSAALTMDEYNKLALPGIAESPLYYSAAEHNLYNSIMMKFKAPASEAGDIEMH